MTDIATLPLAEDRSIPDYRPVLRDLPVPAWLKLTVFWNMAQGRPIDEISEPIEHTTPKWKRRWESFKTAVGDSGIERRWQGASVKGIISQDQQVRLPELASLPGLRRPGFEYLCPIFDQIADVWPTSDGCGVMLPTATTAASSATESNTPPAKPRKATVRRPPIYWGPLVKYLKLLGQGVDGRSLVSLCKDCRAYFENNHLRLIEALPKSRQGLEGAIKKAMNDLRSATV